MDSRKERVLAAHLSSSMKYHITIYYNRIISNYDRRQSCLTPYLKQNQLLPSFPTLTAAALFSYIILITLTCLCGIKQFVVTNCSKERPGSIVNETLKNGISMLKDISKESDFYADFKYISFIKFSLCHQKLRAWKICLILENRG